jgi:protein-S-isoprenylcysteine O-methyltransferase Ste14
VTRGSAAVGAVLFFAVAPGAVAGVGPYLMTRWQAGPPLLGSLVVPIVGVVVIVVGLASLVESFVRFVVKGGGTPAPVAPPDELVVSGQYRLVRNPMYVAVIGVIVGQALALGRMVLAGYALLVWALFHLWAVAYEEPNLRRRFRASYGAYCSHVRRWVPRSRPWSDV